MVHRDAPYAGLEMWALRLLDVESAVEPFLMLRYLLLGNSMLLNAAVIA